MERIEAALDTERLGFQERIAALQTQVDDLARLPREHEALGREHESAIAQLDLIEASPGFQTLEKVRRVVDRVAPAATARGRAAALCRRRGLAYLLNAGPMPFMARLVAVWRWLPRLFAAKE